MSTLNKNIYDAFSELGIYSAVVSIDGYEEYAEDVEGLENAKELIQNIKGNTKFQVLKGRSVGIGKRVNDSRVVEEYAKGGSTYQGGGEIKTSQLELHKWYTIDGKELRYFGERGGQYAFQTKHYQEVLFTKPKLDKATIKGISTYAEGGEIPEGYHQMPNGEIMPDSAHYVKGGSVKTKDFECLTFLHWYK